MNTHISRIATFKIGLNLVQGQEAFAADNCFYLITAHLYGVLAVYSVFFSEINHSFKIFRFYIIRSTSRRHDKTAVFAQKIN